MSYLSAFDISASGMNIDRVRLDVIAMNLANVHTARALNGTVYKPLRVVSRPHVDAASFESFLDSRAGAVSGAEIVEIEAQDVAPRMVLEPGNPDANKDGFVAYPNINPVSEMVDLIATTRSFEANVRVMNAAKTMALKALDIGSS